MRPPAATLYKWVSRDLRSCHGGGHRWVIGEPVRVTPPLVPCKHGIHICRVADLPYWIADTLLEVEVGGEQIDHNDKLVVECATAVRVVGRFTHRLKVLWAADCAERVLAQYLADSRPRQAIETARRWASAAARAAAARAERRWQGHRILAYLSGRLPVGAEPYRAILTQETAP